MRVAFDKADFDALAELWQSFFIDKYHVDAALIKANTVESLLFDWGASCIEVEDGKPVGFVAVKRSATPRLYRGFDPDQAHITALAYKDPNVGIDLMAHTKAVLRDRGVYRLVFGQDARHFFPGCPTECLALRDFLIIEGFQEGSEVHDMERDLSTYEGKPTEAEVRPLTEADVPLLRIMLNREFPGRWAYDVLNKIETENKPEAVMGLFTGATCDGFALVQDQSHKLPIGGAVWKRDLDEGWASPGPVGVAKAKRGLGYGDALVASALQHLHKQGSRKCIVDWTTLTDFYSRHGFEISRSYRPFSLRLDLEGPDHSPTLFEPE